VHVNETEMILRVATAWGLTFILGFERAIRGAPAGDRTFSLIGAGTALIGALSVSSPAVLGGAVTGIGFIGGGLCFRQAMQDREVLHGVTTAASIFAAAAIGAAAGTGQLRLASAATAAVLLSLEIRHIPVVRALDARRWAQYFKHDDHAHFSLHHLADVLEPAIHRGHVNVNASPGTLPTTTDMPIDPTVAMEAITEGVIEAGAARGGR
jgi:uncharacterized membrane protein YhiD involved in acid resistance